uniref:HD domain-containing protein n=1 Tax=Fundidesulfovibrio putealis TaxID=270496 RepID=A0A7C3W8V9_9BACT
MNPPPGKPPTTIGPRGEEYFPIHPRTILPDTAGMFDLYLRRGGGYLLYAKRGERFSVEPKLGETLEITEFYVRTDQRLDYESYLARNLGSMLLSDKLPLEERSKLFYQISSGILRQSFASKLPRGLDEKTYQDIQNMVRRGVAFLAKEESLRSLSEFLSHKYHSYTHSLNVMVLTVAVLQSLPGMDQTTLFEAGLGAALHDIGKTQIPDEIINKPGPLNQEEWEVMKTHPVRGLGICATMPISHVATNTILFHHERFDGNGYPGGIAGEAIPVHARVLALCDAYDALTSLRPYANPLPPYKALSIMREDMRGAFDPVLYKRLVYVLGNARIV